MAFWERMQNIDRRIIFTLVAIAIAIPIIRPIGLPVSVGRNTTAFYEAVDRMSSGDAVIMSLEVSPTSAADVFPAAEAVFAHLMRKGVRVVLVTYAVQGALYLEDLCVAGEAAGGVYGRDFAAMGFVAGLETGLAAFVADIHRQTPEDLRGNEAADLPILQDLRSAADADAYIGFSDGIPGPFEYVRQLQQYGIPVLTGVVTVMGPQTEPYIDSGQIKGLLVGLRSAAEYELLSGHPGRALAGMDAQSAGHLVIMTLIVLGNIAYGLTKKRAHERRGS